MSVFDFMAGGGAGGAYIDGDPFTVGDAEQARTAIRLIAAGLFPCNVPVGGSLEDSQPAEATGDLELIDVRNIIETNNTGNRLSGFSDPNGAVRVTRFRYHIRVNNAAITATPKLCYGATRNTRTTVATITNPAGGAVPGCAATADDYSGANQFQDVWVSVLPGSVQLWRPLLTISGTPAAGYRAWFLVTYDSFILLP